MMPRITWLTRSSAIVQCEVTFCTSITIVMVTPASRELLRNPSRPQTVIAANRARM